MSSPLVLDNVTKRYGTGPPVLDAMSHTFEPGSLTLLVGPNGAGKTTLLRVLSVQTYPTAGTAFYGDLDIHTHPYRYLQHVGLVHAETQLPQHLTAVELLEWILRSRNGWTSDGRDRIHSLLDRLLLDERRSNLIGSYSSGMAQKTQLAAALIAEPEVLLMDEPLRSLDAATTETTIDLLQTFVERGGLVACASHAVDALNPLATSVLRLGGDEPIATADAPEEGLSE